MSTQVSVSVSSTFPAVSSWPSSGTQAFVQCAETNADGTAGVGELVPISIFHAGISGTLIGGTGYQGNTGLNGIQGLQGSTGIGFQGNTGIRGSVGSGVQGNTGVQGVIGISGSQGVTGLQGAQPLQGFSYVFADGWRADNGPLGPLTYVSVDLTFPTPFWGLPAVLVQIDLDQSSPGLSAAQFIRDTFVQNVSSTGCTIMIKAYGSPFPTGSFFGGYVIATIQNQS